MSELIKTILVPVDFSKCSEAAARTGASLAKKLSARVILLHVVNFPDYGSFKLNDGKQEMSFQDMVEKTSEKILNQTTQASYLQGVNVETQVCRGITYKTIIEESKKQSVDIIVMGTHGHRGIEKLLGSTTRRVIRLSLLPVLTVKEPLDIDNVKNIAFASSFNQEYTFTFPSIYQFMELFQAKLHLLKIITPGEFEPTQYSQKTIKDFAASFLIDQYAMEIVNADSIEEGIDWVCSENSIDLLFMATHGRKSLSQLISGSHTEIMGQEYSCPVLSIKMVKIRNPKGVIFPD